MGLFSSLSKTFKHNIRSSAKYGNLISAAGTLTGNPTLTTIGTGLNALGSSFGSDYNSAQSVANQKSLMDYQYQLNRAAYGERHQLEVADLKAAGLNPILSANSAGSIGSISMPSIDTEATKQQYKLQNRQLSQEFALKMKELEIEQTNAETQRDSVNSANAKNEVEMFKMREDVILNKLMYGLQAEMNKAQISQIEQDVINSITLTAAQDYNLRITADAAVTSAQAAMKSADASMLQAIAYEYATITETDIKKAGVELGAELTRAQINEIKEKCREMAWRTHLSKFESPLAASDMYDNRKNRGRSLPDSFVRTVRKSGELVRYANPFGGLIRFGVGSK